MRSWVLDAFGGRTALPMGQPNDDSQSPASGTRTWLTTAYRGAHESQSAPRRFLARCACFDFGGTRGGWAAHDWRDFDEPHQATAAQYLRARRAQHQISSGTMVSATSKFGWI